MAKKVFAGSMMIGAKIVEALTNAVVDAGGTEEDLRRLETNSNLRKQIAELVVRGKKAANSAVRLPVDYTQPLLDLIKANNFDWANNDITEKHFPTTKRPNGEVETKMFHFNRPISSDEAIREMNKEGYRPAELPEGLAYAKLNPNEQRKYPIVILGSVWRDFDGGRPVPCLYGGSNGRSLDLDWFDGGWGFGYRFLAVRK